MGGNQKLSMKEAYDQDHWINKATRLTLKELTDDDYIIYPFSPDGSDERQFSSPGVRIPTTSIHKSKYYEYEEYHTSADDLRFVTNENLNESLNAYIKWFENIESYSIPVRTNPYCEYQLGKYDLYPKIGGAQFTKNSKNDEDVAKEILDAFRWLMHLSDGKKSNFDIAEISNLKLSIINSAISSMFQKGLLIK